jgi:LacI family transcriptional regulator
LTVKDVAENSGVSAPAVSLILNGRGRYAEKTRRRVLDVAQKMGYRPNTSARATRTGRFGSVAVLQGTNPHRSLLPSELLNGYSQSLEAMDMGLSFTRVSDEQIQDPTTLPRLLRERSCDGYLINYNTLIPIALERIIEQHRLPAVWVNSKHATDCVYHNDYQASRDATELFIAQGHCRIAYMHRSFLAINDHTAVHYSDRDRYAGYSDAMIQAGLTPRLLVGSQALHPDQSLTSHQALQWAGDWMCQSDHPTAVVTYQMDSAMVLLSAAMTKGLHVGTDICLHTFASHQINKWALPISTSQLQLEEAGRLAVAMLADKLSNGNQAAQPLAVKIVYQPAFNMD